MKMNLDLIKGVHPGFILERELSKRKLSKGRFAISINEYPQTLVSITKGNRGMNTSLAMRIENALGIEEGFFMILQIYYEIAEEKKKQNQHSPDLNKLRTVLFWDTRIQDINWEMQKRAVIKRVFERGNEEEREEITRFYGAEIVNSILKKHAK